MFVISFSVFVIVFIVVEACELDDGGSEIRRRVGIKGSLIMLRDDRC